MENTSHANQIKINIHCVTGKQISKVINVGHFIYWLSLLLQLESPEKIASLLRVFTVVDNKVEGRSLRIVKVSDI